MTTPLKVRIDRLSVRLPNELGARARAIAPLIASRLADADWTESARVGVVRIAAVNIQSAWSDSAIAGSIARAVAARVHARQRKE